MKTILILPITFSLCSAAIYLSDDEYHRMPPRVYLDPYEECIQEEGAVYCDVTFTLVSEEPSPLLTMIQEFSKFSSKRFNHSKLHYGVCLTNNCKDLVKRTDVDLKSTLEACLNITMNKAYSLKTKVSDEYSCNLHKKKLDRNIADTLVATICMLIVLTNIIVSLLDLYYPIKWNKKAVEILLSFSIRRNWRRLKASATENVDPRQAKLQCLHGFRAITMCLVITTHALIPCFLVSNNTQFVEQLYESALIKLFLNGTGVIQTFFIVSGFLFVYKCLLYEEKKQFNSAKIPKYLANRYLRLTIPYAIVLGLTSTWFRYLPNGPFWQKAVGQEAEDCRRHWWRHLLFINNYYDDSECMLQIWYLGCDMQMAIVGIVVYFLCKNPRRRRFILSTLFVIGAIIPGLHIYFQDLDATMVLNPESILSIFRTNAVFNKIYKRGHTNLNGYVVGLAMGYLVYHWEKIGIKAEKYYKYRFLYRSIWLIGVGVIYTGSIFYEDRPRDPLYIRVLYFTVTKPLIILLIAATIAGTIFGIERFYRDILEWKFWKYLSRLSYSAYLVHLPYIRIYLASLTTPIETNYFIMGRLITQALVSSLLLALVFWILVVAPLDNVMYVFTRPAVESAADSAKVNGHSANGNANGYSIAKGKEE